MKRMKTTRKHRHPSSQSGFTLTEVALASVIMMVGLMSIAQLFALAALHNQSAKQTTLATSLAHRKIEQLLSVPLNSAIIAYGGSLGASASTAGYVENYYVDPTTKQVSIAAAGQQVSYVVTWSVQADPGVPAMTGLRLLTVRAEATRAALKGTGVVGETATPEVAQISTIRTPSQ
jgi:Tfp pilus assembly protein PilV